MATLSVNAGEQQVDLPSTGRGHWLLGRALECDIRLPDTGISRFHATVFRHEHRFLVLDHSLNGTHLCRETEAPSAATRLPTVSQMSPQESTPEMISGLSASQPPLSRDTAEIDLDDLQAQYTRAPSVPPDVNKSHLAFRRQEKSSRLPRVAGYVPHGYHAPEDMRPLLEMIYSADGVETLASMARILGNDIQLILVGTCRHTLSYTP